MTAASSAVERLGALAGIRGRAALEHVPAAVVAFTAACCLARTTAATSPPEWGWSAVGLGVGGGVRARDRQARSARSPRHDVSRHRRGVALWTALSAIWAAAVQAPVLEVERTLVYVVARGDAARHRAAGRGRADAGGGRPGGRAGLGVRARHAPAARRLRPVRRPGGPWPAVPADRLLERARDLRRDDARHLHGSSDARADAMGTHRGSRGRCRPSRRRSSSRSAAGR